MSHRASALREIQREIQSHLSRVRLSESDGSSESDAGDGEGSTRTRYDEKDLNALRRRASASSVSSWEEEVSSRSENARARGASQRGVDRGNASTTKGNFRVRVDAGMEVRLRRAELRKVDVELKLAKSFEQVELARRALEEAVNIHKMYELEFEEASEEFEREQELVYEELDRRERESRAEQMAAAQAAAVVRAEEHRREADASFKRGNMSEAEQFYSHAIAELEVSGIVLVEPSHLWLRVNRATVLFTLGHVHEALAECELVLKVDSGHIRALLRAAQCCLNLSELQRAQRYLEFVSLSPNAQPSELKEALAQKSALNRAFVEQHKVSGNESYRNKDYVAARDSYSSALDYLDAMHLSDSIKVKVGLLTNRAAALMMLGNPLQAMEDCHETLALDPLHIKAQIRLSRCLLLLGQFEEACTEAREVFNKDASTSEQKSEAKQVIDDVQSTQQLIDTHSKLLVKMEETGHEESVDDLERTLRALDEVSVICPHAAIVKTLRAEALRLKRDTYAASQLVRRLGDLDVRGLCVRARIAFDLANVSDCLESLQPLIPALDLYAGREASHLIALDGSQPPEEVIKQIPNPASLLQTLEQVSQISKLKDAGKVAYIRGDYAEAESLYFDALKLCKDSDLLQALFLSNICACAHAMEDYINALASAGAACALAPKYAKAHARLAAIYTELDMVNEAQQIYECLLDMDLSHDEREKVHTYLVTIRDRVKAELPANWRKLLGVGAKPSKDELKKKYRQLALSHHPDKVVRGGSSESLINARAAVSSRLFNLINDAYNVLSDDDFVIKWENARVRAQYKCSHPCQDSVWRRAPFAEANSTRF